MSTYEFDAQLKEAFLEAFDGIAHTEDYTPGDGAEESESEHFKGDPYEAYEAPEYWQDTISELADSAVPIYTRERVELWLELGMPEIDDPGLIEGVSAVEQIIAVAIYEYATAALYELANEYELDN